MKSKKSLIRDSLMVRMGACRVPDRGSIPRRGGFLFLFKQCKNIIIYEEALNDFHCLSMSLAQAETVF